jgi:diguanylate cyclase
MDELDRAGSTDRPANDVGEDIDFDYATAVAERAYALMAQHAVPPTPDNFAVWFQYCRGTWPQFNKTIEIIASSKRPFDLTANRSLHAAYLKQAEHSGSSDATDRLQRLLVEARGFLTAAAEDNHAHIKTLGGYAHRARSMQEPLAIIASLVDELSLAATRASKLEDRLACCSRELDEIRYSLYQAEQRAQTDALTGLANRHALDKFLRRAQLRTMEAGEALSVLFIDIDHFKSFNDRFGHQTGDQVLRLIAQVLKESLQERDLAARLGGEEMIAVMPGANLELAAKVAELIRRTVAERPIVRRATGELLSNVTISIGVAEFMPGESMNALLERCDRALYFAKCRGRNQTVTELEIESDIAIAEQCSRSP